MIFVLIFIENASSELSFVHFSQFSEINRSHNK